MSYYKSDYDMKSDEEKFMDSLKDTEYHGVAELQQWANSNKVSILGIYDRRGKDIGFEEYFLKNMSVLIQRMVLQSPLPIEFTMESVTLYLHSSYSIGSPVWSFPEQR